MVPLGQMIILGLIDPTGVGREAITVSACAVTGLTGTVMIVSCEQYKDA